jgi:hypothetical protein
MCAVSVGHSFTAMAMLCALGVIDMGEQRQAGAAVSAATAGFQLVLHVHCAPAVTASGIIWATMHTVTHSTSPRDSATLPVQFPADRRELRYCFARASTKCGAVESLRWLEHSGYSFRASYLADAASAAGQLAALRFLVEEAGCP